jgi:hypothetical protein
MFLDDEIAAANRRRDEARWGLYLAIAALAACIVMILGLMAQATAEAAESKPQQLAGYVRPNDMGTGALLFPSRESGYFVEAPRLATDVVIGVNGPIMRTRVTQRFESPSEGWVEETYVFPLPEDSAVDTLKMQVGERPLDAAKVPLNLPAGWDFGKVFGEAPADSGKADEREASAGSENELAMLLADRIAAAPTAHAAPLIAEVNRQVTLPQTATEADRQILIGLMLLAIALLAGTAFAFWRAQVAASVEAEVRRHGQ